MDSFEIFDDFLNKEELEILMKYVNSVQWGYNTTSGNKINFIKKYNSELFITTFFGVHDITDTFFTEYLKNKINTIVNNRTNNKYNIKINRLYMHTQIYGQDGLYHTDDLGKDKITFCIYLNEINNRKIENSNGEFFLKLPEKDEIICIDTFYNRGIIFKSEYFHRGMAYNKKYSTKRICITWKLELIDKII